MKLFQMVFMSFPLLVFPVLLGMNTPDGYSLPPNGREPNGIAVDPADPMTVIEGKVVLATDEMVSVNFNGQMEMFQINADTKIMKDDLNAIPIDLDKDDLIRVVSVESPSGRIATSLEARSNK